MNEQRRTEFNNCVICNGQGFGRMACVHCELRIDRQLQDILEFYALTEGELAPGRTGTGGSNERGIGVRIAALDFLAGNDVVAVLASWEDEWRETYELTNPTIKTRAVATLATSSAFLRQWLPTACTSHPAIDEFAREIRESWQLARTAARQTASRQQTITCPNDTDNGICGHRININADDLHSNITCKRCRCEWNIAHLIHVAISTPDAEVWVDPEAASGYFGIHEGTLRKWAKSDRIKRSHGRYELHSIYVILHDTPSESISC